MTETVSIEIKTLLTALPLIATGLLVPAIKYWIRKESKEIGQEMNAVLLDKMEEIQRQTDRELSDLRKAQEIKVDKIEIMMQSMMTKIDTVFMTTNDRIIVAEKEIGTLAVRLESGEKHYEQFQKEIRDSLIRLHERLDALIKQ